LASAPRGATHGRFLRFPIQHFAAADHAARDQRRYTGFYVWQNPSEELVARKFLVRKVKVKCVDLYSALSRSASNVLPLPVSRHCSLQANPTARHSANTARPRIRVGVSHSMPVYSPSLCRVLMQPGPAQDGQLVLHRGGLGDHDGHPPRH